MLKDADMLPTNTYLLYYRAKLWLKACYRDDLLPKAMILHKSGYRLCELHFEEKFISKGNSKKRLFSNVVPSIFSTKLNDESENTSEPKEKASEESQKEATEEGKREHRLSYVYA